MKVYLAGPINGRTDGECRNWRLQATQFFGAEHVLDPMRRDYRGIEAQNAAAIVEQDKADILSSSAVLLYFDAPSVGTACELMYAHHREVPVFVAHVAKVPPSPWLVYHAKVLRDSLRGAMQSLLAFHAAGGAS
jgi:nucleoside 2-deoxyribosyltransferase